MKTINKIIDRFATSNGVIRALGIYIALVLLVIFFVKFVLGHFTYLTILDLRLFFTPAEALEYIESLGGTGRQVYFLCMILDSLYAMYYSFFTVILYVFILGKKGLHTGTFFRLRFLGFVPGICDLLQNIANMIMIVVFPIALDGIAWFSTVFTALKFGTFIFAFVCIGLLAASTLSRTGTTNKINQKKRDP